MAIVSTADIQVNVKIATLELTLKNGSEVGMTVAQLIRKLQKMPQDAIVTIPNNDSWLNGYYEVTELQNYDDEVLIDTDYKHSIIETEMSE